MAPKKKKSARSGKIKVKIVRRKRSSVIKKDLAAQQEAYLAKYRTTARHDLSIAAAKVSTGVPYAWRQQDPEGFGTAWHEARLVSNAVLEDAAIKRGRDGYRHPVYQRGQLAGYEQIFSDQLLTFILKGRHPEVYGRDRVSIDSKNENKNTNTHGLTVETADAIRRQVLGIKDKGDA